MRLSELGEAWLPHLRIAMLRALADCPSLRGNESLLVDMVAAVHIAAERDHVRDQLAWLHDKGLVVADVAHGVMVAVLTERGEKVASGIMIVDGVKRPGIGRAIHAAADLAIETLKRS